MTAICSMFIYRHERLLWLLLNLTIMLQCIYKKGFEPYSKNVLVHYIDMGLRRNIVVVNKTW